MTVTEIISFARRIIGNNVSREEILSVLNARVQELLDGFNPANLVYYDTTTGKHPYLVTTAAKRIYDWPSWANNIQLVYDVAEADAQANNFPSYNVNVDVQKRKIIFQEDPGSTTTSYAIIGTYNPTSMTSENDSLCLIPEASRFPLLVSGIISGYLPNHSGFGRNVWEYESEKYKMKLISNTSSLPKQRMVSPEFAVYGNKTSDYRRIV